jgi:2-C-methyl-D-erythritol 4-phosphate cytidylyltransferase/2-C-methyl-D-erythritol 2,4-cyclodiphosphate synthase
MFVSAIIAAGGRGLRLGGAVPKQLLTVAGRSILERSVAIFLTHPDVDEIVVALPSELVADPPPYLKQDDRKRLQIVAGGDRRQDSVSRAFQAVDARADVVVIHDAARPFATPDLISRTIAAAAKSGAALAAVPARDTVKRSESGPAQAGQHVPHMHVPLTDERFVTESLTREEIFLAQTPQAFRREVLNVALSAADSGVEATDEASLAERAGYPVAIVYGEATNIKVTTPEDLTLADAIARKTSSLPARTGRAGTGYDLHRLVAGRPLILGGVTIPSPVGALGHSDADVVCHAITDAVFGAVGLGDIGRHFPDSDPRWKDASSLDLLARANALAAERGYEVGNVDVTVVLEKPKIRDHIDRMCELIAGALGIDPSRVSIKGKTNEGVDAVGRGEAIAAHAVALLRSKS